MVEKYDIRRPCSDCYRLVRATFENSVGKMLIRHLKDFGVLSTPIDKILMRHLGGVDGDEPCTRERQLSCDRCGAAFITQAISSEGDEVWAGRRLFWVGWRANHQGSEE